MPSYTFSPAAILVAAFLSQVDLTWLGCRPKSGPLPLQPLPWPPPCSSIAHNPPHASSTLPLACHSSSHALLPCNSSRDWFSAPLIEPLPHLTHSSLLSLLIHQQTRIVSSYLSTAFIPASQLLISPSNSPPLSFLSHPFSANPTAYSASPTCPSYPSFPPLSFHAFLSLSSTALLPSSLSPVQQSPVYLHFQYNTVFLFLPAILLFPSNFSHNPSTATFVNLSYPIFITWPKLSSRSLILPTSYPTSVSHLSCSHVSQPSVARVHHFCHSKQTCKFIHTPLQPTHIPLVPHCRLTVIQQTTHNTCMNNPPLPPLRQLRPFQPPLNTLPQLSDPSNPVTFINLLSHPVPQDPHLLFLHRPELQYFLFFQVREKPPSLLPQRSPHLKLPLRSPLCILSAEVRASFQRGAVWLQEGWVRLTFPVDNRKVSRSPPTGETVRPTQGPCQKRRCD